RTSSRPFWPPRPTATACRRSSASTSSSTSSSAASTPRSPSSRTPSACSRSTPDQWDALHADPSLAAGAVEEALRYEPITPFTARIVVEDMEVRGVAFPAGTVVLVAACTANRDGLEDADRFDITRTDGGRLTTFGAGIHYCLGANLARAELQEGLGFLAARIERLELDGEPAYSGVTGIYGLDRLPIRFSAA
ncbi:MAG TPA: cytochrome P450, partial [Solirubrobacteraceae bacterium]|nr:cytochrome P450 [Solirubrobacteraceae bacterium]